MIFLYLTFREIIVTLLGRNVLFIYMIKSTFILSSLAHHGGAVLLGSNVLGNMNLGTKFDDRTCLFDRHPGDLECFVLILLTFVPKQTHET